MNYDDQLSRAFKSVTVIRVAEHFGIHLKIGLQKSPFREDKHPSFSVYNNGFSFKDHADDSARGGAWKMAQLCAPQLSPGEIRDLLVSLNGEKPSRPTKNQMRRINREKREDLYQAQQRKLEEIPQLECAEPGPWPPKIKERWEEGKKYLQNAITKTGKSLAAKLAESRGWDERVITDLVSQGKTACPLLPWSSKRENKRGWGWLVEKPIFQGLKIALIPVGYHVRYKIYTSKGKVHQAKEKRWTYIPYVPTDPKSEFQAYLKRYNCRIPAYPFVLGDLSAPRLVIILEGQFDAVSFAEAFQWLEKGFPAGISVFGLRGVSSPGVFLAAYGRWLKKYKPCIWLLGDNDDAGRKLVMRRNNEKINTEPCFVDRLRAQGCKVRAQYLNIDGCKDFNDVWRSRRPTRQEMIDLAKVAGYDGLITGEDNG